VVTAENADGESAVSSEASTTPTPNPAPPAPTGVTAAPGPTQATINWSTVPGVSYNLYYSTTTGVTKATGTKIPVVTSPKVVDSLVRGVPYYFVVTAENADGESVDSTPQATATPIAPVPQFAQTDLEGAWNAQVILFGANPGWYRYTALVNNAGNVTIANPSFSSGLNIPAVPAWSIAPGTGSPEFDGLQHWQLKQLLRGVVEKVRDPGRVEACVLLYLSTEARLLVTFFEQGAPGCKYKAKGHDQHDELQLITAFIIL